LFENARFLTGSDGFPYAFSTQLPLMNPMNSFGSRFNQNIACAALAAAAAMRASR